MNQTFNFNSNEVKLLDCLADGVIAVDRTGRVVFANSASRKMIGVDDQSSMEISLKDISFLDLTWIERMVSVDNTDIDKRVYIDQKGWHRVTLQHRVIDNETYNLICIKNIDEVHILEEALRYESTQSTEVKKIAELGHWTLDIKRNILTWSDEVYKMFGVKDASSPLSYDEFLGKVHPEDRIFVDQCYMRSINQGVDYDIIHRVIIDDEIKHYREKCVTYFEKGEAVRSMGMVQDVTAEVLRREKNEKEKTEFIHTQSAIIVSLIEMTGVRDYETGLHMYRTQLYIKALAEQLVHMGVVNLDANQIEALYACAPLHDIGKTGIDDNILKKPGPLTDEEYDEMKKHPQIGYDIISKLENVIDIDNNRLFRAVKTLIMNHHERWDGKGYPQQLVGDENPIEGQMMALVDAYDAMRSVRVYKGIMSHEEVVEIIKIEKGKQFSPVVVEAFLKIQHVFEGFSNEFNDD